MKLFKYTEEQLRDAVNNCASLRQVLLKLKVAPYGGNYAVLKKAIKHFHLDTTHFHGQAWSKGKSFPAKQPLSAYLENRAPIQSYKLKNRLLREGIFKPQCMNCHRTKWSGHPIPLELAISTGTTKQQAEKPAAPMPQLPRAYPNISE